MPQSEFNKCRYTAVAISFVNKINVANKSTDKTSEVKILFKFFNFFIQFFFFLITFNIKSEFLAEFFFQKFAFFSR